VHRLMHGGAAILATGWPSFGMASRGRIKLRGFANTFMSNCMYCGAADVTVEHPLPRGLGNFKDYVPLTDRVCTRCNSICGQLDEQLCRCGSEAFFRKFLGISGRSEHDDVNSFYRGSSRGGRLEMLGTNHETGEEKELELEGPNSVRELRCVKFVAEDGSTHTIPIKDGMTRGEFRKNVASLGFKFFKQANISAASEEIPWVESLFEGFEMERKVEWVKPTGPIMYGPFSVKFTVNDRYFRAIAKIGFHYFLTKFPRFRGDEHFFSDIRNFIMNSCPIDDISQFVTYSRREFVLQLRTGGRLAVWGHLMAAYADHMGLGAKVQLFVGPQSRSIVYTVRLGSNPSAIHYSESYANFFAYYPPEKRVAFDGEVAELSAVSQV
jgi:hypothetical protein